jgi:MFS family permease
MESDTKYKKFYSYIFIFFYLIEGFVQGIPFLVFPSYLAKVLGNQYDISLWLIVAAIGNIPWAIKLIVGLFNDRYTSKKFGNRFPWIFSFGIFGAIWWFILAFYLPTDQTIYTFLALYYFMTALGIAFADTALDGLILDITPKERLGRIQGYTWTMLLLGMGAGGMLLGLIFLAIDAMPILFILTGILTIIACFLPYYIQEPELKEVNKEKWNKDLLSVFTKRKNWKVFSYTFLGAIQAVMLLTFFNYVILVAMGVIDVQNTILSIIQGDAVNLLGWSSLFYLLNGIGTVIGSLISGRFGDISRRRTVSAVYLIYIPFCLISVLPFIFIDTYIVALVFGIIFQVLFGAVQGALVVSNQTVRGDLSKKDYPNLKSTYYALLVSFSNGGQNFGTLAASWLFTFFALFLTSFNLIYFFIASFCSLSLLISFLLFRTIDPKDYEFKHLFQEEVFLA